MHKNEVLLRKTVSGVLGISSESLNDDSSMDTVKEWDSLKHLNLVLGVEQAFGISFTEEQILEMLSYPLIKIVLTEHGIAF